jgi:hypothetical protein
MSELTTTTMRDWILYSVAYMLVTYGICAGFAFAMCQGEPWVFDWRLAVYILVQFHSISCPLPHYLPFCLTHKANPTARPLVHNHDLWPRRVDTHTPRRRTPANLQAGQDLYPSHGDMVWCGLLCGMGAAVGRRVDLVVVWLRFGELGGTETEVNMVLM